MVTYSYFLAQFFCGKVEHCKQCRWHVCVCHWQGWRWVVLAVFGQHWVYPSSQWCVLSRSTLLRLQVSLQGYFQKQALHFMPFPGLGWSDSVSRYFLKGTDSVEHAFCALPSSEQLRRPGAWQAHCPRGDVHLSHLPGPSPLVSWVCNKSIILGVLYISSG